MLWVSSTLKVEPAVYHKKYVEDFDCITAFAFIYVRHFVIIVFYKTFINVTYTCLKFKLIGYL